MPPPSSQSVCRTCLAPGRLQPIFSQEQSSANYAELILTYSGVKVEVNDGYPQGICLACIQLVKSAAFFQKIARRSDEKLRALLPNVPSDDDSTINPMSRQGSTTELKIELHDDSSTDGECKDRDSDSDSTGSVRAEDDDNSELSDDPDDDKKLIDLVKTKSEKQSQRPQRQRRKTTKQIAAPWTDIAKVVIDSEPKIINRGDKEWRGRVRAIFKVSGSVSGPLRIECRLCGVVLKQRSSMHVHAQKHLGYRVICEACGKGFPNNCALQQHCMNRHGLKKSFSCTRCPFTSSVKFELTVHERTHTGERPFVCDTCGSSFYRRRCLIVHTRSHSDVRPHKCTSCEKRFISRGDMLAHHNAVHQRRYVFPCPVCGHTYARRTTVYKHVAAQHDVTLDRRQLVKILL